MVPAFAGLYAPHWKNRAQGLLVGLTSYVTKEHLARAVLEATAWQTAEVVEAMTRDSGVPMTSLAVDGGMTGNNLLMQTLSDCLGVPVVRPMMAETVALGAAYGAGLVVATGPTAHSSGRTGTAPPSGPLKSKNTKDEPSSISGSMQCSWPSIGARDLGRRRTATRAPCATSGSPYGPWHRPTSMTNGEGSKRARVVIVAAPSARAHLHDYAWTSAPATSSIAAVRSFRRADRGHGRVT